MITDYEQATVIELGRAQDLVLGNKEIALEIEAVTLQFGGRFIDDLDGVND